MKRINQDPKPVIIFRWLNVKCFPAILFFRARGWRVIYIEPIGALRNKGWVRRLKPFGVELVDYPSYQGYIINSELMIVNKYARVLIDKAYSSSDFSLLCQMSATFNDDLQLARSVLFSHIVATLGYVGKAYALAEYFVTQGHKASVYHPRTLLTDQLVKFGTTKVKNRCLFHDLSKAMQLAIRAFKSLPKVMRGMPKKGDFSIKDHTSDTVTNQRVLYFPHKGMTYGQMFFKDQYYSMDRKSPFHQNSLRHVELNDMLSSSEHREVLESYQRNNIKVEMLEGACVGLIRI